MPKIDSEAELSNGNILSNEKTKNVELQTVRTDVLNATWFCALLFFCVFF